MQATEYDIEPERRAMKYPTLDNMQTMIGKAVASPGGEGNARKG
jgi:hypothetical protein